MEKLDYKKEYKDLYLPKITPSIINVPKMKFVIVEGKGNPNEENGEYKQAMSLLYGISFTIKMSKMGKNKIEGYFEYVVPPLEGLWWQNGSKEIDYNHKEKFEWISMIRQPEFVTQEIFEWACDELKKKKQLDTSKIKFIEFEEGLCVQTMHIGSYDNEPQTLKNIDEFIKQNNLKKDIGKRKHHEIYLSDPRRTIEKNLKTVIRIPVEKDEK
jgi:hypothetical protein